jgi:hypothetical protein
MASVVQEREEEGVAGEWLDGYNLVHDGGPHVTLVAQSPHHYIPRYGGCST